MPRSRPRVPSLCHEDQPYQCLSKVFTLEGRERFHLSNLDQPATTLYSTCFRRSVLSSPTTTKFLRPHLCGNESPFCTPTWPLSPGRPSEGDRPFLLSATLRGCRGLVLSPYYDLPGYPLCRVEIRPSPWAPRFLRRGRGRVLFRTTVFPHLKVRRSPV